MLGWLKQQVPPQEQAALLRQLRHVVADRLLQQLLLTWLSPSSSGREAADAPGDGAEAMAVDGAEGGNRAQGAPPGVTAHPNGSACCGGRGAAQDEFVCCRRRGSSGVPGVTPGNPANGKPANGCSGRAPAGAAAQLPNGCLYDRDLEEAGCPPSTKPPLRVSWRRRLPWHASAPHTAWWLGRAGPG